MLPWGNNYSPSQMLDMCKVDGFEHDYQSGKQYAAKALALVAIEKDPAELVSKLSDLFHEVAESVSIGRALDRLVWLAKGDHTLGLDYGRDGLDCLTYHLSGYHCTSGIAALQAVLHRFEDDTKKPKEEPREKGYYDGK